MEKIWKATNNKIKQRIRNVHIFNCHMDVKRGPRTKAWRNAQMHLKINDVGKYVEYHEQNIQ